MGYDNETEIVPKKTKKKIKNKKSKKKIKKFFIKIFY